MQYFFVTFAIKWLTSARVKIIAQLDKVSDATANHSIQIVESRYMLSAGQDAVTMGTSSLCSDCDD